jgi:uncharacterized short protein YbdD (DUF466 family)
MSWVARVLAVIRRIVGVPDYDAYVAHLHAHHPGTEPLGQNAFLQKCWEDKYTKPGNKCC